MTNDVPRKGEIAVTNRVSFIDSLFAYAYPLHPLLRFAIDSAVIIAAANAIFLIKQHRFADLSVAISVAAVYMGLIVIGRWIIYRQRGESYNQVVSISPQAIRCLPKNGAAASVQWAAVQSISQKFGAIIIKVSEKPSIYFWINKRSFTSESQATEFFERARGYLQACRNGSDGHSGSANTDIISPEGEKPTHALNTSVTLKELVIGNWLVKQKLILILLTVLFALTTLQLVTTGFKAYVLDIAINATALLVILAWVPWLSWRCYRNHPERLDGKVSISPQHLRTIGAGFDTCTPWSQVREVSRTETLLIFTLERQLALVIPTRAFPSREETESFYTTALSYQQQHQPAATN